MLDPIFEADLPPEQYAYAMMLASEAKAESQNVEKLYNRARLKFNMLFCNDIYKWHEICFLGKSWLI